MKRIGLTQRVHYLSNIDERRDCLDQAWTTLLNDIGYLPVLLPNKIQDVDGYARELQLDGVIFTGGNDLADQLQAADVSVERDAFEKKLLTFCSKESIPILGVCRGLQLLVIHYGGRLVRIENHVAMPHAIKITKHDNEESILDHREQVNSFHNYGILEEDVSDDLIILATVEGGFVEAVMHKSLKQYGIMWHPERDPFDSTDAQLIKRIFS